MIRFEHTLFALPFALASALVGARGMPAWDVLGWILLAMFGARSAAMGFNRIVDRHLDALNPRTCNRELPTGRISLRSAVILTAVCAALFVWAAYQLNLLAFYLSFPALVVIGGYSFTKRFTDLSHFVLGLCLALAPVGAWIAVRGEVSVVPAVLALGVVLWVAGFDIIYSTLDDDFDRRMGLHSMVQRLGLPRALSLAQLLHILFVVALVGFGLLANLGWIFHGSVVAISALLMYEHSLVRPDNLARVNVSFFTMNAIVSFLVLATVTLDILVQ